MVINLKGEVVAWNQAMESLTGVKAADILGKGNYEYALPFYGERRPVLIDLVMHPDENIARNYTVLDRSEDGLYGELRTPYMRNEEVYLYAKASLLRNSRGEITGAIESVGDITETKKSEKMAKASLREKETLLKEIHHRVKNNMQVISSLLALQSQFVHDREDEQLFQDSQERIRSMALVYNKLYQSKTLATICMKEYVEELATNLVNSYSMARECLNLKIDVGEVSLGIEHAIPCGLIINELLVNAMKHAFPDGRFGEIYVSMHQVEQTIAIEVSDNGVGLPSDFDLASSPTLGVGLVHSLCVDQMGGAVEFIRLEQGTKVDIKFILYQGMG
jgi:PAS domain S-box-containing protein